LPRDNPSFVVAHACESQSMHSTSTRLFTRHNHSRGSQKFACELITHSPAPPSSHPYLQ
jgi:hypothetical protein